jgi:hypothetical protein
MKEHPSRQLIAAGQRVRLVAARTHRVRVSWLRWAPSSRSEVWGEEQSVLEPSSTTTGIGYSLICTYIPSNTTPNPTVICYVFANSVEDHGAAPWIPRAVRLIPNPIKGIINCSVPPHRVSPWFNVRRLSAPLGLLLFEIYLTGLIFMERK